MTALHNNSNPYCPCNPCSHQRIAGRINNYLTRTSATVEQVVAEQGTKQRLAERKAKEAQGLAYPIEADEQKRFVQMARKAGWATMTTVNGAHLSGSTGQERARKWGQLRACGATKGAPDLCLIHPLSGQVAWVEMKRVIQAGGVVSQEQQEWIDALCRAGQWAFVGWGADDAWEKLCNGPGVLG